METAAFLSEDSKSTLNHHKENVLTALRNATTEFLQLLSSFSQESINAVPFEGSWTAAQVGEHVLKSDMGVLRAMHGEVKPTERPPVAGLEGLKATFLDFSTKLNSPKFILPSPSPHDKETLLRSLQTSRSSITEAAGILDLTHTCVGIPALGEITRLELLYFVTFHTQRHLHQLQNIAQKLS